MTYITIDTKTKQAKKFVELIETLPFAKILKDPNATTRKLLKMQEKVKPKSIETLKNLFLL